MTPKARIYAFVNGQLSSGTNVNLIVVALSERGELATHLSSNAHWAKHDIGVTSDWKHDAYNLAHPEGWEIEWVDEPEEHPALLALIARLKEST